MNGMSNSRMFVGLGEALQPIHAGSKHLKNPAPVPTLPLLMSVPVSGSHSWTHGLTFSVSIYEQEQMSSSVWLLSLDIKPFSFINFSSDNRWDFSLVYDEIIFC